MEAWTENPVPQSDSQGLQSSSLGSENALEDRRISLQMVSKMPKNLMHDHETPTPSLDIAEENAVQGEMSAKNSTPKPEMLTPEPEIVMDPALWCGIPEDLYEHILARLPIQSFFRMRCVCKKWRSLLFSPAFRNRHSKCNQISPTKAWILMFADVHYKMAFAFLPDEQRFLEFSLDFLPSNIYYLTGSAAAGIVCFRLVESNGASSMCVGNPITRSWRRLPPLLGDFYAGLVGMSANPKTMSYMVVVRTKTPGTADFDFSSLRTEVYDSRTGAWSIGAVPEDDLTMGKAVCGGVLYFMTWEARNGIYAYYPNENLWINISPPWPYFFTCPHLVECGGDLLLVGGFGKQHVATVGIRVWVLRTANMEWELMDSMPGELFEEFLSKPGGMYFDCVGHARNVYFVNYDRPPAFVVFDVDRCLWKRLCTPKDPPPALYKMFLCFSFSPQLGFDV